MYRLHVFSYNLNSCKAEPEPLAPSSHRGTESQQGPGPGESQSRGVSEPGRSRCDPLPAAPTPGRGQVTVGSPGPGGPPEFPTVPYPELRLYPVPSRKFVS
eukprot:756711-Hanusia_phi.AAC.4